MTRILPILFVTALWVMAATPALADTQYGTTTTGSTYTWNWTSICVWWDGTGRQDPCFIDVWSTTQATISLPRVVEVDQWAENLGGGCLNYVWPYCDWYYVVIPPGPDPQIDGDWDYAYVTQHDPDAFAWPSATRGYAEHIDWSYNNGQYTYWTSDGY